MALSTDVIPGSQLCKEFGKLHEGFELHPVYDSDYYECYDVEIGLLVFHIAAAIIWMDEKFGLRHAGDYLLMTDPAFLEYVVITDPALRAAANEIVYDDYDEIYHDIPAILNQPFEVTVELPDSFDKEVGWLFVNYYKKIPANLRGQTIRVACATTEEMSTPPLIDQTVVSLNEKGEPIRLPDPFAGYVRKV